MLRWLQARVKISIGRRCWEIQALSATEPGGPAFFTGPPYVTRKEALEALEVWRRYDFATAPNAVNVETGERIG